MRRPALAACLASTLAACVADLPPEVPQGSVEFAGVTYPVTARGDLWFVTAGDRRVQCRAATSEDCYWSLRAHLAAEAALADLG
ncbi:hypothetical protein [Frigidibacter sp. SD6-1]|uniref:hypothetical protein n=1 Tax=Frigidibacter sp. SD6-1 TaxID=3032581 RepID=UPI0024DFA0BB|nr:hypothetical protein [Frigidibacter sp. SD6-1]